MREIKVRMWADGRMDYDCRDLSVWNGRVVPFEDGIIMQSTGLKDKGGKEIYEGDVLKPVRGGPLRVEFFVEVGTWSGRRINKYENFADEAPVMFRYMEIIGNIYENPELVGK